MFREKYIGDKAFYKRTLSIAVPLMFQGLLVSLAGLLDNLMVAGLGDSFLSGVAAANRFFIIYNFGVLGVVVASGVFIGQYLGAHNKAKMKESFRASIILSYIVALPFFLLILLAPQMVIQFFTHDPLVIASGLDYYKALVWTIIPLTLILAVGGAIRSIGDTRTPIIASVAGIIVNVIFNFLLINGALGFPKLGVLGAAIATLISRVVELIFLLFILSVKKYDFNTKIKDMFKIDRQLFKSISKNAFSTGANEILWASSMAVLMKFYATRGAVAMSAYAIAGSISDIFFVLFNGMSAATVVLVAQLLGADKFEEAKSNGNKLLFFSVVLAGFLGVVLIMISGLVPYIYKDISVEAQTIAVNLLRVIGSLFWVFMYNVQILFMLRAGGDSFSAFLMDSGFMWLVNIPIVGIFTYFTNVPIILLYIIGQMTDIIKLTISTFVFKKEKWVRNVTNFN